MAAAATLRRGLLLGLRLHNRTTLQTRSLSSLSHLLHSNIYTPPHRFFSSENNIDFSTNESKRRLLNRLVYRSKQRGFLELDLVLGSWVEQHIHSLDEANIRALAQVLNLENPDLWKWLTGQEQPPETVNANPVFAAVRSKVLENLTKHASPETRSAPGQPWVRGWDDKRGIEGPKYGNQ